MVIMAAAGYGRGRGPVKSCKTHSGTVLTPPGRAPYRAAA